MNSSIKEKIQAAIASENANQEDKKLRPELPKVQWEKAIDFEENGIVVSVSVLPTGRPRYSAEIGTKTGAGRFGRYLPLFMDGRGNVTVRRIDRETIDRLLTQAEDYAHMKVQENENAFIEFRLQQEQKRAMYAEKGEHKAKPGLKALAKKDKIAKSLEKQDIKKEEK